MIARSTSFVAVLITAILLSGCDSSVTRTRPPEAQDISEVPDTLVQTLNRAGFDGASAERSGNGYVVEGDIAILESTLYSAHPPFGRQEGPVASALDGDETPESGKQAVEGGDFGLVDYQNAKDITVNLGPKIEATAGWADAVRTALTKWNQISDTPLSFREVDSGADITVCADDNADKTSMYDQPKSFQCSYYEGVVGGLANPPSNRETGDWVLLNDDCSLISSGERLEISVHELGHTIGFRHTNWNDREDKKDEPEATRVPHTPSTGNDPTSVMNASYSSWDGFSNADKTATRVLYGDESYFDYPYLRASQIDSDRDYTTYSVTTSSSKGGYIVVQYTANQFDGQYMNAGGCYGEGCTFKTRIATYLDGVDFRAYTTSYMPNGPQGPIND